MPALPLLIALLTSLPSAPALTTREGGGARADSALVIHDRVGARAYPLSIETGPGRAPLFKGHRAPGEATRAPLVLTSVLMNVALTKADAGRVSRGMDGEALERVYVAPRVRGLVDDALDRRGVPSSLMAFGVDRLAFDRATFVPPKPRVEYRGPLAVQLVSRWPLQPRTRASEGTAVRHQVIDAVGLRLEWWQTYPSGLSMGASAVLRTYASGAVGLGRGSTGYNLILELGPADRADLRQRIAEAFAAANASGGSAEVTHSEIYADLLDEKLGTVARYRVSPRLTRSLMKADEVNPFANLARSCWQWLM